MDPAVSPERYECVLDFCHSWRADIPVHRNCEVATVRKYVEFGAYDRTNLTSILSRPPTLPPEAADASAVSRGYMPSMLPPQMWSNDQFTVSRNHVPHAPRIALKIVILMKFETKKSFR